METRGKPAGPARVVRDPPDGYEPPGVERVLTPADLEREILYAGPVDVSAHSLSRGRWLREDAR